MDDIRAGGTLEDVKARYLQAKVLKDYCFKSSQSTTRCFGMYLMVRSPRMVANVVADDVANVVVVVYFEIDGL
jgi:hypothetical protein